MLAMVAAAGSGPPLTTLSPKLNIDSPWRLGLGARLRGPLARQMVWSLLGNGLTALWSLTMSILAARRLETPVFGRLALLLSVQVVLNTIMNSALGQTAVRMTAELREQNPARLRTVAAMLWVVTGGLTVACTVVFLLGGPAAHAAVLGPLPPQSAILAAGAVLLCTGLIALQQGFLAGFGAFGAVAGANAVRLAVGVTVLLLAPPTLAGAVTALAAGMLAGLLAGAVLWTRAHRGALKDLPWTQWVTEIRLLWTFAVPSWLTGALFVIAAWLGNLIIANGAGGFSEVGYFNAASQWGRSLLLFVPNAIAAPLLVAMSALWGRQDTAGLGRLAKRGLLFCFATTAAPCILVYLLDSFLLTRYGVAYLHALPILHILLISTTVASFTIVANVALTASGRMWTIAGITGLWAVAFLAMLEPESHRTGVGLAHAYLVAYAIQTIVTIPFLGAAMRRIRA
ncbi:MAG TPA: oligosaccharide flippase family protein [Gemmatimonadales bacterium]